MHQECPVSVMRIIYALGLALALICTGRTMAGAVILEPDKLEKKVGHWEIYRARWGHGCVVTLNYSPYPAYLALGGEKKASLFFYLQVAPPEVGRKRADEFLETVHIPEISLRDGRYTAKSYDYRSEVGVTIDPITKEFQSDFLKTKKIKYLENGSEKLVIHISNTAEAMRYLLHCIENN